MPELEWRAVTQDEFIRELGDAVRERREGTYAFQVGLKDLEFEVDEDKAKALELTLPFQSVDQAEQALREGVIRPTALREVDDTEHRVMVFDPQPVAFSGFMNCVTHSLALTDRGLFEVGRYPAMSLGSQNRYWQWFLHRRLATSEQVAALREDLGLLDRQIVDAFFECLTGRERRPERWEG